MTTKEKEKMTLEDGKRRDERKGKYRDENDKIEKGRRRGENNEEITRKGKGKERDDKGQAIKEEVRN